MGKKDVTQFIMKKIDQLEQTRCIFFCDYIVQLKHSQRTYTHLYELRNANPTPKHLRRLSRQILEIDKVIISDSLSMGTLSTTENTILLNPRVCAPMNY